MLLADPQARPIHFPADPAKFVFDREVADIFPDMARRAIPNFYEAHAAHAEMLKPWLDGGGSILDVGSSRGGFFHALTNLYNGLSLHAVDNSVEMCGYLKTDYPDASVRCVDITSTAFLAETKTYDVVCANYVLQFLPERYQGIVFTKLLSLVRPGGVFIYGHKGAFKGTAGALAHEQYIRWRLSQGYTREEIEAKTAALKGSMFPLEDSMVKTTLRQHRMEYVETFRFMMFSTLFAIKGGV